MADTEAAAPRGRDYKKECDTRRYNYSNLNSDEEKLFRCEQVEKMVAAAFPDTQGTDKEYANQSQKDKNGRAHAPFLRKSRYG